MDPSDPPEHSLEASLPPTVTCTDCTSAFRSPAGTSFLLLDQVTAPVIGCETHLSEFAAICGYATAETPQTVAYRPAGGVACPSCRLAVHNPRQPVIPVTDGAVGIVACPEHQTTILNRFHTGLETKQQVTDPDVLSNPPDVLW
jgi:hypothetical protein